MPISVDQLLALLGIDDASAVTVIGRLALVQRDPQPDETGVDDETTVDLMVVDLDGDPEDATEPAIYVTVYVDQGSGFELAYSYSTGFESAWSGPESAATGHTTSDPYRFVRVVADQTSGQFDSEEVVEVQVVVNLQGGFGHASFGHYPFGHPPTPVGAIDETYEFTIEDLTTPRLLTAEARDFFTVRLTFDEGMQLSGTGSSLLADAYSVECLNKDPNPGVGVEVLSVAEVIGSNGTMFDLTFDREMTSGCTYEVTVDAAVTDEVGNAIDSDHDTAQWSGFQPLVPSERRWEIWDFGIPNKNRREDEEGTGDLRRFTNILQEVLDLDLYYVDHFTDQWDPDLATDAEIDAMLYDVGNPFDWSDLDLTATQKRKLLRLLVPIYKLKGTAVGIEGVIFFLLGITAEVLPHNAIGWILGEDELGEGSAATMLSATSETWDFSGGKTLTLQIDFETEVTVVFADTDFGTPTVATSAEVSAVIDALIGSAGLDIGEAVDESGQVELSSNTVGHGSRVEVVGGTANDLLQFSLVPAHGVGGAMLAPSDSFTRYAFDIEVDVVLSSTEERIVRRIGDYMKAAHEHLVDIIQPIAPVVPDHWSLGESELGEDTILHE